jgi:hypothetical protein
VSEVLCNAEKGYIMYCQEICRRQVLKKFDYCPNIALLPLLDNRRRIRPVLLPDSSTKSLLYN